MRCCSLAVQRLQVVIYNSLVCYNLSLLCFLILKLGCGLLQGCAMVFTLLQVKHQSWPGDFQGGADRPVDIMLKHQWTVLNRNCSVWLLLSENLCRFELVTRFRKIGVSAASARLVEAREVPAQGPFTFRWLSCPIQLEIHKGTSGYHPSRGKEHWYVTINNPVFSPRLRACYNFILSGCAVEPLVPPITLWVDEYSP